MGFIHKIWCCSVCIVDCNISGDDGLMSLLQVTKWPFNLPAWALLQCTAAHCKEARKGQMWHVEAAEECLHACVPAIWYLHIAPDQLAILQPVPVQSDKLHITHCKEAGKVPNSWPSVTFKLCLYVSMCMCKYKEAAARFVTFCNSEGGRRRPRSLALWLESPQSHTQGPWLRLLAVSYS